MKSKNLSSPLQTLSKPSILIEELQQEAERVNSLMISRDTYVEKRFKDQEREINSLKRKGCESCKATGSAPKLARRTEKAKQNAPVQQKAPSIQKAPGVQTV